MSPLQVQLPPIEAVSAKVHEAWIESKKAKGVVTRIFLVELRGTC